MTLTKTERLALEDLSKFGRSYIYTFKPGTMAKLAEKGLARRVQHPAGHYGYHITDEGEALLRNTPTEQDKA